MADCARNQTTTRAAWRYASAAGGVTSVPIMSDAHRLQRLPRRFAAPLVEIQQLAPANRVHQTRRLPSDKTRHYADVGAFGEPVWSGYHNAVAHHGSTEHKDRIYRAWRDRPRHGG